MNESDYDTSAWKEDEDLLQAMSEDEFQALLEELRGNRKNQEKHMGDARKIAVTPGLDPFNYKPRPARPGGYHIDNNSHLGKFAHGEPIGPLTPRADEHRPD